MRTAIAPHELLPKGLDLQSLSIETGRASICVSSGARRSVCPLCGRASSRVHSRYLRTVSDLPWHGISVELEVLARRFFYDEASCERKIFCERLEEVAARARKTVMLEEALVAIALELGGRAGARLALELGIVAARDALLRRIKAVPLPEAKPRRPKKKPDARGRNLTIVRMPLARKTLLLYHERPTGLPQRGPALGHRWTRQAVRCGRRGQDTRPWR
jgi:hypothetical protein